MTCDSNELFLERTQIVVGDIANDDHTTGHVAELYGLSLGFVHAPQTGAVRSREWHAERLTARGHGHWIRVRREALSSGIFDRRERVTKALLEGGIGQHRLCVGIH